jgi:hypothetical protein
MSKWFTRGIIVTIAMPGPLRGGGINVKHAPLARITIYVNPVMNFYKKERLNILRKIPSERRARSKIIDSPFMKVLPLHDTMAGSR